MISINNIKALSDLSLDYLILKWEIDDTTESLKDYQYNIYRSVGIDGEDEYEYIDSVPGDMFEFFDTTALQYKRDIHFYYKVIPVHTISETYGDVAKCISMYDKKTDTIANYIRHVNKVYLSAIGNTQGYLLTKRRFGQRCTLCWDDIRRQHKKSQCPNCFGTGYEGGYHKAYKMKFNYMTSTSATSESVSPDGKNNNNQDLTIWTESYPLISVGDIFVDEKNYRYKVSQVQRTTKNNEYVLRQVLNIQLLSTSDPVYGIIINTER